MTILVVTAPTSPACAHAGSGVLLGGMKTPDVGEKIPLFSAPVVGAGYEPGAVIRSEDLADGRSDVVLYFYPKDDTPGCTKQACALRDGWDAIKDKARVFGVSINDAKSHEKFIQKYDLPFPLIVDVEHKIADLFGVWVEKSLYGRKYWGTERSSFVMGPDGTIKAVLRKVAPGEHLKKVLAALG